MTALPLPAAWPRFLTDAPPLSRLATLIAIALIPMLAALAMDHRLIDGQPIWLKPVKFHLALFIYLITLVFFARYLPPGLQTRRGWRLYEVTVILAILAELVWIGGAAAAGTTSHFNVGTPAMAILYGLMGMAATLLTSLSFAFGIAIARNRATGLSRALHHGVALGLILTLPLTLITAGTMSGMGGHFVGTTLPQDTLWLMGWSRTAGDLRVSHFFATHALHAVPLAALAAHRLWPARAVPLTWAAAALWSAFVLVTFQQALSGQPFLP
jgi:hypothetical protein